MRRTLYKICAHSEILRPPQERIVAMDVNSAEWSQREFRELSSVCDFKEDWKCSKTNVACKDYICPLVKVAADIKEVRANFVQQAKCKT